MCFIFNVWKTTQPISEEETKHDQEMAALAAENPRVRCQMFSCGKLNLHVEPTLQRMSQLYAGNLSADGHEAAVHSLF